MTSNNKCLTLFAKNDLRFENRAMPTIGKGRVGIRVKSTGICGSDVHYWKHGSIGHFKLTGPMVIGHESGGVICEVGEGVDHLKVGDRVAIEPGVPCKICWYCKTGRYNLCSSVVFCATPPHDGSLCQVFSHDASFCFKIPDSMTMEEAALCEPVSVGVHACERAGVCVGRVVLILGAGPIGLVNAMVAKAMGADRVIVTDVIQSKLDVAKRIGADDTVLVKSSEKAEEIAKRINDIAIPDCSIECSGFESSVQTAVYATKSGGCVVLVGMGQPEIRLPVINALCREVDIKGIFRYVNAYPKAISLISSKRIAADKLITHRFSFDEAVKAFETAADPSKESIKCMINLE